MILEYMKVIKKSIQKNSIYQESEVEQLFGFPPQPSKKKNLDPTKESLPIYLTNGNKAASILVSEIPPI